MAEYYVSQHGSASDSNDGSDDTTNAWATPGYGAGQLSDNDILWIKGDSGYSAYAITSTTDNVANGPINTDTLNGNYRIEGYETTAGDDCPTGNRPILDVQVDSLTYVFRGPTSGTTEALTVKNIHVTKTSGTGNTKAFTASSTAGVQRTQIINCQTTDAGIELYRPFEYVHAVLCYCEDSNNIAFRSCNTLFCVAKTAGGPAFNPQQWSIGCIAIDGGSDGYTAASYTLALNCIAYNCSSNGFEQTTNGDQFNAINCIAVNNGAKAFENGAENMNLYNCASYNNTTGRSNGVNYDYNAITLSGDPFTSAGTDDFTLNNTAGAGADCREAGITTIDYTGYMDVGLLGVREFLAGGVPFINSRINSMIGR